jgi:hypothetical protein
VLRQEQLEQQELLVVELELVPLQLELQQVQVLLVLQEFLLAFLVSQVLAV